MVVTKEDLLGARGAIDKILDEKNCGPIFVRLAWHDSGKFIITVFHRSLLQHFDTVVLLSSSAGIPIINLLYQLVS